VHAASPTIRALASPAAPVRAAVEAGAVAIGDAAEGAGSEGRGPQKIDECRRCGKLGHWAWECRSKAKKDQAHAVQDEEASLMVLTATVNHSPVEGALVAVTEGEKGTAVVLREEKVFVQLGKPEACRDTSVWIVDTGVTNHMTRSCTAFIDLDTRVRGTVRFGDDSAAEIEGRGKVEFVCKNGELRRFDGVYFIPKLTVNIMSVGRLDEDGYRVLIDGDELAIREPGGKLLARVKQAGSRLYLLHVTLSVAVCQVTRGDEMAWRWHERLGHLNFPAMKKLVREDLVQGLPDVGLAERSCEACLAGKQRRASFPAQAQYPVERVLQLVHDDLYGKISLPTPSGNEYFLLMVDDRSRFMSVVLLSSKSQAAEAIKSFQFRAEAETGQKLCGLRTDRGGEFNSTSFLKYCLEKGVQHQLTAPYSPQQNGVVECRNSTVVGVARSMLKAKGLPNWF
jgi:hypothetical protein